MRALAAVSIALFFSCSSIWSQGSIAQIHGTVQDTTGAAVPGAEIKATQTATGIVRMATTGADGGYVLTNLPIGPYQLEVTKEGFAKSVQSGIELQVNADPGVDVSLKVGNVSEQVEVEANAALVETRSSGVGEVIQNQRILELPLNGRNVTDLITLAGAAVNIGNVRSSWFLNTPQISIGGQSFFESDYSFDGANHLNFLTGTTMLIPFPDAVQEFKVESSGQTAQHGAASSVSVVTKSGTNEYHGDLFEFLRNDGFGSAREYFSTTTSTLKRNQFGGVVGGPIKKNKLFFFFGFQDTITHQNPGNSIATIPTAAMMAGDWTTFASPQCNAGVAKTLKAPFVNNMISPSAYTAPAVYITNQVLASLSKDGITPNQCGNITYNTPNFENDRQYSAKIDFQLSDKQSIFFRMLDTSQFVPNDFSLDPDLLNWTNVGYNQLASSYAVGDTYLIGGNIVQSFRAAFNRTANQYNANLAFSYCTAGVNIWCGANPEGLGTLSITGGFPLGSTSSEGEHWDGTAYSINDDVNFIRGAHQMSFGGGAWQGRVAEFTHFASVGQLTFNGTVTGLGMADFFLGDLTSFLQGLPNTNANRQNSVNLYFADTWKITSRLTFNFGVRWEPFLPMNIVNGQVYNFSMSRFLAGTQSTQFVNAPPGFYYPGDPGFPGDSGTDRQWAHFDPRGGLAWDPKGDGKMSIRAAYAFGYAYVPGITREDQAGSNPWGGRTNLTSPPGGFANPWQGFAGGNPFPYAINQTAVFTPQGQFLTTPYNLTTPHTYSWNVAVQRQFGASWITSVTYLGSRIQHLYVNDPINYAEIVPGPSEATGCAATALNCNSTANTQARRVISILNPTVGPLIGNMDQWDPVGWQRYNGLLMSVQKRLSKGVSMSANWTWSHCEGIFQGWNSKPNETVTVPNDPTFDRGNCDTDRREIVNITAVAQAPQFSNRAMHLVVTGWQLAGIYRFSSGAWLAIQDGTDRELTGLMYERPNQLLSNVYTGQSGPSAQYLNPAAFSPQPLGTVGNLGWNSVLGPTYWDLDVALSRDFRIRERQTIQLRADAFNLTNSFVANPALTGGTGGPATPSFANVTSNQFGQILAAFPTRKIQFALKYVF